MNYNRRLPMVKVLPILKNTDSSGQQAFHHGLPLGIFNILTVRVLYSL